MNTNVLFNLFGIEHLDVVVPLEFLLVVVVLAVVLVVVLVVEVTVEFTQVHFLLITDVKLKLTAANIAFTFVISVSVAKVCKYS